MSPVLVIKHGALGDLIQAFGPFAAIRQHHPGARVVLLTTPPFERFCAASGLFDQVWIDSRPSWWRLGRIWRLARRLRSERFGRVYDLQTSDRSSFYLRLFGDPKPEWSGIAAGCSHPHSNPARDAMHTVDRQAEQLAAAGIAAVPPPDFSWVQADIARFDLPRPFALLVPGGSAHRPEKRWPLERYAALAAELGRRGIRPAVLGGREEAALAAAIPGVHDLTGRTDLFDLVGLARDARFAIGNDTGPMHLIAAVGCRAAVLFSRASDPALCAPRGRDVTVLRREYLAALTLDEALRAAFP
ncbi:MAG: glycosyltransferase family 9 protein [Alphaproteobacteria bacterium]|nr:glycosyltransferase family 9 protein [Alphaproteobacteria bacterium]